ncbi:MAG TPA: hypothetical protein DDZ66_15375 [Firmicutes bacterium]|nr:hypothetical protein [Bacillota bacterium]
MSGDYKVLGTSKPDNLHAGVEVPLLTKGVKLAANQGVLARGSVIGIVTVGGLGKLCDANSVDGSQVADCILVNDTDTGTGTGVMAVCYQSGIFHRDALTVGLNSTIDDHAAELRAGGIYLRDEYPIEPVAAVAPIFNVDLSALTIGDLELNPAFSPSIEAYLTTTDQVADKITATAASTDTTVAITVNGVDHTNATNATWGEAGSVNVVVITVTHDDDETKSKVYIVLVERES